LNSAKQAMKELKKINSVIEMEITYPDYKQILLETKPSFDDALSDVPEGDLKKALSTTMKAYVGCHRTALRN
jgi:hypothetical protein